ncbi:hypothetical protein SARC_09177 [Sphaeroforma arctica JP610]|uniref:Uncharacterized protein n=1 Tax=Sphaeroforma arctica JP610 TaxID=667725 RepID=A0A0L0FNS1_9EUKA|nr:hypothetical protein SARC_09177 [Sphaeroforma arctica JP610]KNC78389.1 hypothetical protein SARC_09177 [Sphaeroforma arctica JP610]|eukprot:XP_014152291.1 hypothetical protein SARC_09177 [Sphaeroforma arctica JP610]
MSLCNRLRDVAHTYAHIAEKELQFTLCRAIEWCDAQEGDTKMRAPPPERTDTSIIAT